MTNREKVMEMLEGAKGMNFAVLLNSFNNCHCCIYDDGECEEEYSCIEGRAKWLEQEYKEPIKLTEADC